LFIFNTNRNSNQYQPFRTTIKNTVAQISMVVVCIQSVTVRLFLLHNLCIVWADRHGDDT